MSDKKEQKIINNIKEVSDYHLISSEFKSFFTSNEDIINIAKDVLGNDYCQFEIENIKDSDSNVLFKDVKNSSFFDDYCQNKDQNIMIAAGGPAAEEQIIIAATSPEIKNKFDNLIYLTKNYLESNIHHSTKQIHSRNSSALYANDYFAGHKLLKNAFLRFIFPKKYDFCNINYPKIDVKLSCNFKLLKIYFLNEFNWLYQKVRKLCQLQTSYDLDLEKSQESLKIQQRLEKTNKVNLKIDSKSAIEIILKNQNNKNISNNRLSQSKINKIFGNNHLIENIFLFNQDNVLRYDIHDVNSKIAKKNNVDWQENTEIKEILMDGNNLAGIVTNNKKYIYANKLHLSLGYKVKYQFDKGIKKVKLPDHIIATGLSMVVIIRNSVKSHNIFNISSAILLNDIYVSFIAQNNDYILLKIAAGANIGSDKYKNSYFFNILKHLEIIFDNDLIGVLSCYACCRAINSCNSTKFTKIGDDIIISSGKGGSGNSKRYYEGNFALRSLSTSQL
ncbi:hypothetical protein N8772_00135 [Rickettsiales bacterium]|nr:hypothetical protein [Rickettsiales bacterium]MDB2550337.1 hypothetical protein [Rickettsiales bacterium]